jgi:1-acyl-sn-glycerol-3-phosphate acyltransferase
MLDILRGVRSLFSVLIAALLFLPGSLVLRLIVVPGFWLFPRSRPALASAYMKAMSHVILGFLTLGGARFRRVGNLPTASPVLIVGNHQSLLDIPQVALLSRPYVPAFVARRRYARFIPLVSTSMRLIGSPVVDPRRDPAGALEAVRRGAGLPHGLVVFPEGHRSRNGEILPFRTAGCEAVLRERPLPVYLVLNDGCWRVRRFVDLLFGVHGIDALTEVLGPFSPPSDPDQLGPFLLGLREKLVLRLREHRGTPPAGGGSA